MRKPPTGIAVATALLALSPFAAGCGVEGAGNSAATGSGADRSSSSAAASQPTSASTLNPVAPAPTIAGAATAAGGVQASETGIVGKVVGGGTVDVRGVGRVRVLGIDTPERGECGFGPATSYLKTLVLGRTVALVSPDGSDDEDRYGRKLRYLDVDGTDAGLAEIMAGLARARYDSRDGYGAHPREQVYIAADTAAPSTC